MRFRRSVGTAIAVGGALVALSACSSESPQDHAVDVVASCIAKSNCDSMDTSIFASKFDDGGSPQAAQKYLQSYSVSAHQAVSDDDKLESDLKASKSDSSAYVEISYPGAARSIELKFDSAGKVVEVNTNGL